MENSLDILNELREISPALTEINRSNVYSVNTAFFDNLSQEILEKINTSVKRDDHFTSVLPYKVNEGYFETLSDSILSKIKASANQQNEVSTELDIIAPVLNTINKGTLYTLPAGYFETLQPNVGSQKPKGKVVTFSKKVKSYAAAAVVTALMAIGSYLVMDKNLKSSNAPADNVNTAIRDLKDDEIINFLKTRTSENVTSTYSEKATPAREMKQQLKEMSDQELQQFINENGEPDEIEVDI